MANLDWNPVVDQSTLKLRAEVLRKVRRFMNEAGIMEVETPILASSTATDPNIRSFETRLHTESGSRLYLQTSPEFHMKRLLAAGSGPIFQISRAFRDEESGRYHNPEFTMLEWYRPGFDHHELMNEIESLLGYLGLQKPARISYADVFLELTGFVPHSINRKQLIKLGRDAGLSPAVEDYNELLDFVFNHYVISRLKDKGSVFVFDFPQAQAALARLSEGEPVTAARFELFIQGLEIANGFHELCDPREQKQRFESDLQQRSKQNKTLYPIDRKLLSALESGMPDCAGVALGLDRLLMVLSKASHIREVLAFPIDRA